MKYSDAQSRIASLYSDLILVHGAGLRENGELHTHAKDRVDMAVHVFKDGYAPKIVMSDGIGAKRMKEYAVRQSVSEDDIFLESESTSTAENMIYTKQTYMEPLGWKAVQLVSNYWHGRRVEVLARKILHGYNWSFVGAPDSRRESEVDRDVFGEGWKTMVDRLVPGDMQYLKRAVAGSANPPGLSNKRNFEYAKSVLQYEDDKHAGYIASIMELSQMEDFKKSGMPVEEGVTSNVRAMSPVNKRVSKNFRFGVNGKNMEEATGFRDSFHE